MDFKVFSIKIYFIRLILHEKLTRLIFSELFFQRELPNQLKYSHYRTRPMNNDARCSAKRVKIELFISWFDEKYYFSMITFTLR